MQPTNRGHRVEYITQTTDLQNAIEHLRGCAEIGFDFEFDNNLYTYGFNLCLVQIATPSRCFVIDPYPFQAEVLQDLWAIFSNPAILKIIHAGGEDFRLLNLLGCQPKNLFDTELCANLLSYPKTSLSNVVFQNFAVELDKGLQVSNWTKRPLSSQQINYAANDVVFLLDLKNEMVTQLVAAQKTDWFAEEMQAAENTTYVWEQKTDYVKKTDRTEFSEFDLFVLTELFKFRDGAAKKINKPTYQVFNDDFVRELVRKPEQLTHWPTLRGIIHYLKNEEFRDRIQTAYQAIKQSAIEQNLSTDPTAKKRNPNNDWAEKERQREELKIAKEKIFAPIKAKIAQKYGDFVANSTLSNHVMNDLVAQTLKIKDFKTNYKKQILTTAAQELGIDLGKYF